MKLFLKIFTPIILILCAGIYCYFQPTTSEMISQMIIVGFRGDGTDTEDFRAIANQIQNNQIGGVILFDTPQSALLKSKHNISNITSVKQLKKLTEYLQSLSPTKLLIAIDQEGGNVQRLKSEHGFKQIPSAKQMAKASPENTYNIAYDLGLRLSEIGINTNFAPVLDVDINNNSTERSFSNNPDEITKHAYAFAHGMNDAKIIHSFKHFPGYSSSIENPHYKLVDITDTYKDFELKPWQNILSQSFPMSIVMTSHVINKNIDNTPASLSSKTTQKIKDLGFNGVIISDDLDMLLRYNQYDIKTVIKMAINAGNDILLFNNRNFQYDKYRGSNINKMITEMVKSGEISKSRVKQSYRKIMKLKKRLK